MKNRKLWISILLLVIVTLTLSACATANPMKNTPLEESGQIYGFWYGFWDGFIAPWAFIANVFGANHGIYQVHNNGNWYDFGFLLGIGAFASGGASASSRRRRS
jgi:hypothetical protein